jgi:multiple sugar transport system substrate-binding protein
MAIALEEEGGDPMASNLTSARRSRRSIVRGGAWALLALGSAPLLAACGAASATPTAAPAKPAAASAATSAPAGAPAPAATTAPAAAAPASAGSGSKAEVVFSNSTSAGDPTRVEAWDKLIADFEKTNPTIAVKKQYVPDTEYYDKMVAQAATGTLPDVVSNRSDKMDTWAASKILLELDDLIKRPDFKLEDFYPEARKVGIFKDKTYGIPRSISSYVLYYNKDLFDKAGVGPPDDKLTWSGLPEVAKKLTKDTNGDGKLDQWGYLITANWKMWISLIWSNGADYMDKEKTVSTIDSKESTEAIQQYLDLVHVHRVAPTTAELAETGNQGFLTGRIGMYVALEGYINVMRKSAKFAWDIAPIPAGKVARATPMEAGLYAISAKTKVKDDAYKLFSHMLSSENQDFYAQRGTFPSRQSVVKTFNQADPNQPPKNIAVVGENFSKYVRYWPVTTTWEESSKAWESIMQKAVLGEVTAQAAHADYKPKFDKLLQEHQKIMKSS